MTVEFDRPRKAAVFGRVIYEDLMQLPGVVTFNLFGHEVELMRRNAGREPAVDSMDASARGGALADKQAGDAAQAASKLADESVEEIFLPATFEVGQLVFPRGFDLADGFARLEPLQGVRVLEKCLDFLQREVLRIKLLDRQADGQSHVHGLQFLAVGQHDGHAAAGFVFERAGGRREANRHEANARQAELVQFGGQFQIVDVGRADDFEGRVGAASDGKRCFRAGRCRDRASPRSGCACWAKDWSRAGRSHRTTWSRFQPSSGITVRSALKPRSALNIRASSPTVMPWRNGIG